MSPPSSLGQPPQNRKKIGRDFLFKILAFLIKKVARNQFPKISGFPGLLRSSWRRLQNIRKSKINRGKSMKTKENSRFSLASSAPRDTPGFPNFDPHQLEYENINFLLRQRARKRSRSSRTLFLALRRVTERQRITQENQ